MRYVVRMSRQGYGGNTVRYVLIDAESGLETDAAELKASALPDPPPEFINMCAEWEDERQAEGGAPEEAPILAPAQVATPSIRAGSRVEVIKSRVSGVRNPPTWLEEYLGRTGVVLWTTADGAMVDLGHDVTWFSYSELVRRE